MCLPQEAESSRGSVGCLQLVDRKTVAASDHTAIAAACPGTGCRRIEHQDRLAGLGQGPCRGKTCQAGADYENVDLMRQRSFRRRGRGSRIVPPIGDC